MTSVVWLGGALGRHVLRLRARLDRLAGQAREAVIRIVAGAVAAVIREALRAVLGPAWN